MFAVESCEPGLIVPSHTPGAAAGVAVTPGNNTYGTYAQIVGSASAVSLSDDAYEVWININSVNVSASSRDCLITIGIDYAGGTSYVDWIVDLYGSCASPYTGATAGGISYVFPLFVPAGASLAAKASVNNATVGTAAVQMRFKCRPTRPDLVRCGTYVRTFGSTPASSSGRALTPGLNAEGSYVQLGSAIAAGDLLWFWQLGVGFNNAAINNNSSLYDLAIGSAGSKRNVINDLLIATATTEALSYENRPCWANGHPGDLLYARAWSVGTAQSGQSAIAYGVGG